MKTNQTQLPRKRIFLALPKNGFALVATLTLLSLLSIIAIGLLSLSSIEARRSGLGASREEARANARLGLMVALGQLQRTLGPDNAITASAGVGQLEEEDLRLGEPSAKSGLKNYIGVWNAAENPRGEDGKFRFIPPIYATDGQFTESTQFKEWLVSNSNEDANSVTGTRDQTFFQNADSVESIRFNNNERGGGAVKLVAEGSVNSEFEHIRAGTVAIYKDREKTQYSGNYAYWVGDNGMKAYVKATDKTLRDEPNGGDFLVKAATPGVNGIESFESLESGQGNFTIQGNTEEIERVFGVDQLELIDGFDDVARRSNFHDITANADSLLANVTSGGLRKDLSLYFDASDPAMGGEWSGFARNNNAPIGPYGQLALSEHDEFDTGAWSMLRQHAKLHRAGSRIRRAPGDGNTFLPPVSTETGDFSNRDYPGWNQQKRVLAPVILRGTMLLSIGAEDLNDSNEGLTTIIDGNEFTTVIGNFRQGDLPKPNNNLRPAFNLSLDRFTRNNYLLNFASLPLVTLWNPYNVPLRITDGFMVKVEGTGTVLDVNVSGSSLPFHWAVSSGDGMGRRSPVRGLFFDENDFEIAPGATATFGPDLTRDPAPDRSQFFKAVHIESQQDLDQILEGTPPFQGGFIFNSLLNSGRAENDGYDNDNENFTPFGRLSGFMADASHTIQLSLRDSSPFGELPQNESNVPGEYEGLLNGEIYSSLAFGLVGGVAPNNEFNRSYGRDEDSAKVLSKVNWRSDTGNPVSISSGSSFGPIPPIPMSFLQTGDRYYFASVDLRLKSLNSSDVDQDLNPNATWLHSIPSHTYNALTHLGTALDLGEGVTSEEAIATDASSRAYTLNIEPLSGNILSFTNTQYQVNFDDDSLAFFFGKSYLDGQSRAIAAEIPLAPLQSIAQFMHSPMIPIDASRWSNLNVQNLAVSNSYANPMVDMDQIIFPLEHPSDPKDEDYEGWKVYVDIELNKTLPGDEFWNGHPDLDEVKWAEERNNVGWKESFVPTRFVDRSYIANTLLWDDFFFSGLDDYLGRFYRQSGGQSRNTDQVIEDFVNAVDELPNATYRYESRGLDSSSVIEKMKDDSSNYLHSSEHIIVEGGFNVNSLSVKAWRAFLASNLRKSLATTDEEGAAQKNQADVSTEDEYIISRYTVSTNPDAKESWEWTRPATVTSDELDDLAEKIVQEVADRGPFRSIGEFVNRRVDSTNPEFAVKGALQAALDKSTINEELASEIVDISGTSYRFPQAAAVSHHAGSPEYVMQGDLLNSLGPAIQARSDSFKIRAYGESADGRAKVWCEAEVSRSIDYVDSASNEPHEALLDLNTTNQNFGRQFRIKSFRWLDPSEV